MLQCALHTGTKKFALRKKDGFEQIVNALVWCQELVLSKLANLFTSFRRYELVLDDSAKLLATRVEESNL